MLKRLVLTFAAASTLSSSAIAWGPREPGCDDVKTTMEGIECRTEQMQVADIKLQQYLQAATLRAKQLQREPEALVAEQVQWQKYLEEHCGNVYLLWREGTIRYEMSARCTLRLTRMRTYDIWAAYLTSVDSTPPVLPDPSK